jgi:Uncharacterized protein conserved in bacteria
LIFFGRFRVGAGQLLRRQNGNGPDRRQERQSGNCRANRFAPSGQVHSRQTGGDLTAHARRSPSARDHNVFNVAKPDGLTILASNPNVAIAQLSKVEQVRFDVNKFQWLGSSGADGVMFSIRSDLPYKSVDELKKSDKELVAGTTGPGSNAHDFPLLLKEFAGLKLKLVSGYPSNSDVLLAIERKEVDSWSALATTIKLGADRGAVRPLVRGRVALPGFEKLPIDEDLATSALGKSLMAIKSIPGAIGRAFAVAPGTPADRLTILRDAFAKAIKDPELIAEAKKAKIEMNFISAEQVMKDFNMLMNQTPETLKEMGKYIKAEG